DPRAARIGPRAATRRQAVAAIDGGHADRSDVQPAVALPHLQSRRIAAALRRLRPALGARNVVLPSPPSAEARRHHRRTTPELNHRGTETQRRKHREKRQQPFLNARIQTPDSDADFLFSLWVFSSPCLCVSVVQFLFLRGFP